MARLEMRGRREGRVSTDTHGPRAIKKHGEGTTGSAGHSGLPCAMVLRLIRALPRNRAFLLLSQADRSAHLTSASGGQDHAISASASASFVRAEKSARIAKASIASPP